MDDDKRTKKRTNVLLLAWMMVCVVLLAVVAALLGAKMLPDAAEALLAGAVGGAIGVTSALSMLAKAILDMDNEPFDAAKAAHQERLMQLEYEAKRAGESERTIERLIEWRSEHARNGDRQNE